MAEALVSIAVAGQPLSLFAGATRELEKLSSTFQAIQAVLDDAERWHVGVEHVQLWLSRLRHAACDIEDLLVDASNHAVSRYNVPCRIKRRYDVAHRIKEIRERLDQINDKRNMLGFGISQCAGQRELVWIQRLTTWLMDKSEMVIGREDDKETLVSRLVSESSTNEDQGQVQVVSIVGIGGLGKTALARQIYHDAKVGVRFNQALYWVCVSDVFDVIRLTKAILEQVKGSNNFPSELDALPNELLEALRGKRFLLVLDDVWNEDKAVWKRLRLPLNSGAQGSRILITTRSQKVAESMNATYIHDLKGLSDDDSWELFRINAFARKQREEILEFENVGREIVNNCNGVPLSIKVIGSALCSKKTEEDWKTVLDCKIWSLQEARKEILPALLLTYCHLPAYLKQCFAYCSVFPKDWNFRKNELVSLWVAQGFIKSDRNRDKEDIGYEYFDDLVGRSMFQEIKEDDEGKIMCKMHGLLHDLAEFIAKDGIYTFISKSKGGKSEECPGNVRHAFLSLADGDDKSSDISVAARRAKKLRTFWLDRNPRPDRTVDGGINSVIYEFIHQARLLRALYLPFCTRFHKSIGKLKHLTYLCLPDSQMVKLPDAIGKMRHLRYLDLSGSDIVELPESVSHLPNLHTLDLTGCVKLKTLPRGMGGMVSLRYLEIERTDNLECLPKGLGRISGLKSLCKFIVGDEGGDGIDELQQLNSLRGTLRIQHLERVSSPEEARKAELWNKRHLRRLVLSMFGKDDAEIERTDDLLEGLQPHENLEELKLFWYTGSKLSSWMKAMPCLRKLVLCGCPNLEGLLPHLDGDSLITELMIRDCPRIKGISGSSSFVSLEKISVIGSSEFFSSGLPHLPNLRTFEIRSFINETLPDGGWEQLAALKTLEIWNCSELKYLPDGLTQPPSLKNLIIYGCDKLERLPEGLGQLKELTSLTIGVLKLVTSLPDSLEQLKLLQHLEVSSCKKLESLPDGLQHLYLLRQLSICGCPRLSERFKRDGGVDWHKISHISYIEIDKQRIH